jgi:hypothetical protein
LNRLSFSNSTGEIAIATRSGEFANICLGINQQTREYLLAQHKLAIYDQRNL